MSDISFAVIVVTAMGYVTIASSTVWYAIETSFRSSLLVFIVYAHLKICLCLYCISSAMSCVGFSRTPNVRSDLFISFLVNFYGFSLSYPFVR